MKQLFSLSLLLLFGFQVQAQLTVHQVSKKQDAAMLAEAPQKVLTNLNMLRGFGSFLKVDKSDENYDNLVGFYEIEKENNFLVFFVQAQLYNQEGKVVAKSNNVKAKLFPGDMSSVEGLAFPGDMFDDLEEGEYELRLSFIPIEKEVRSMVKNVMPELPLTFTKK
ncbi:MAG: hypothetical protein AAF206_13240 [Bacteroidota bacterium]